MFLSTLARWTAVLTLTVGGVSPGEEPVLDLPLLWEDNLHTFLESACVAADLDGELVGAEAGRPTTGQDDAGGGELDAVRGVRRPASVGGRGGRHR